MARELFALLCALLIVSCDCAGKTVLPAMMDDAGCDGGPCAAPPARDADIADAEPLDAALMDAKVDAPQHDASTFDAEAPDAASDAADAADAGMEPKDAEAIDAEPSDAEDIDATMADADVVDAADIVDAEVDAAHVDDAGDDADAAEDGSVEPDFMTQCFGLLAANARGDAIHVEGTAGTLGEANYTIWGYSGGSTSNSGFVLNSNDAYGQEGAPLLITGTAIAFTTFGPQVETGITYEATSNVLSGGLHMRVELFTDQSTPWTNCGSGGAGTILFTRYGNGFTIIGGYEFACPSVGLDVRGCFRFRGDE